MTPMLISHAPIIMVPPALMNTLLALYMIVRVLAEDPALSIILGCESLPPPYGDKCKLYIFWEPSYAWYSSLVIYWLCCGKPTANSPSATSASTEKEGEEKEEYI